MALPSGAKSGAKGPCSEPPPPDAYADPKLDKMYNYMQVRVVTVAHDASLSVFTF